MIQRQVQVAFLSAYVYPLFNPDYPANFGGAEVDQYNLAVYLAQNPAVKVFFYVGDYGQPDQAEIRDGVNLVKIPYFGWHNKTIEQKISCYSHLCRTLWKSPAQVILTEMADDMVGWAALFFKVLRRRFLIHRLASDRDTYYTSPAASGGWRTFFMYRMGLKHADLIFSQTSHQQKELRERMGFDSQVVPNGFFIYGGATMKEKTYILWVGRCTALKQPELFLELAKRIPEKEFVMIMPPPITAETADFKARAAKLVEEAETLPNLHLLSFVPFNKIQQYYNQAQLFVNTSEYEGFPNTFVQSCLGGTPIASLKVDPDGVIARFQLGAVCNNDFDKLLDFVNNLSTQQVQLLGSNAREYGEKYHNMREMGEAYEAALEKLLTVNIRQNRPKQGDLKKGD